MQATPAPGKPPVGAGGRPIRCTRTGRALLTRTDLFTERQKQRLDQLWATDDDDVALQVTWGFYQELISAYGHPKKQQGRKLMNKVINALRKGTTEGDWRSWHSSVGLCGADVTTSWRSSTSARRTPRWRRSTGGWNICVASLWGFRNLNHYILVVADPLRTVAGPDQRTLNHEEPLYENAI